MCHMKLNIGFLLLVQVAWGNHERWEDIAIVIKALNTHCEGCSLRERMEGILWASYHIEWCKLSVTILESTIWLERFEMASKWYTLAFHITPSFFISLRPQPTGMVLPTFRVYFSCSVRTPCKHPHKQKHVFPWWLESHQVDNEN